jgi:hypothetical protein
VRRFLALSALTVLVASACSGAPEPSAPAEDEIGELPDLAMFEATDASADSSANAERLRALQARLERLKARAEAQKARLAVLEEEARQRRARQVEKPSAGESLAMAVIAVALAAIASRRRKGQP